MSAPLSRPPHMRGLREVAEHTEVRRTSSTITCTCGFVTALHMDFAGALESFGRHCAIMRHPSMAGR